VIPVLHPSFLASLILPGQNRLEEVASFKESLLCISEDKLLSDKSPRTLGFGDKYRLNLVIIIYDYKYVTISPQIIACNKGSSMREVGDYFTLTCMTIHASFKKQNKWIILEENRKKFCLSKPLYLLVWLLFCYSLLRQYSLVEAIDRLGCQGYFVGKWRQKRKAELSHRVRLVIDLLWIPTKS